MSLVALALLAVAQPAPVAETVTRRQTSTAGRVVPFQRPIWPALNRYQTCLDEQMRAGLGWDLRAAFERHISHCASVRAAAISEAHRLLEASGGWSDDERRRATIDETFDTVDASHLDHARQLEEMTPRPRSSGAANPEGQDDPQ